jgi:hypothetical protein
MISLQLTGQMPRSQSRVSPMTNAEARLQGLCRLVRRSKIHEMTTVKEITAAIAELPPEQVEQIRVWLQERAEAEWDAQIEQDERAGRLDALADRALAEHRAGRTRPL